MLVKDRPVPQDAPSDRTPVGPIARPLDLDPDGLGVRRCPTGKSNTTSFIEGGAVPLVLRSAPPDDRDRVLFYEHRRMRPEPAMHALLRERTVVPVPAILAHDFDHSEIGRNSLLMERLPGRPISDLLGLTQDTFENILREGGRCLWQAHALTGDRSGYVGDHRPREPQADGPSAFRVMGHALLDDLERCGGDTPDEATDMRRLWDRSLRAFDRPVPASLRHRDVWAEDLLADVSLADASLTLGNLIGREARLRAALAEVEADYDFAGVDTSPTRSVLTINVLVFAAEVLIPIEPGLFSLSGLGPLPNAIEDVRRHLGNGGLAISGLVLTRTRNDGVSRDVESQLRAPFGELVCRTAVPSSVKVEEAHGRFLSVLDYAPRSSGAKAYESLGAEIVDHGRANIGTGTPADGTVATDRFEAIRGRPRWVGGRPGPRRFDPLAARSSPSHQVDPRPGSGHPAMEVTPRRRAVTRSETPSAALSPATLE